MAVSESAAVYPGTSSLDPSRPSLSHPQLHSPIPLSVVGMRPPPPSSLPQPHFGGGGGRLLRSGASYPASVLAPPHRASSSNSIHSATSPTLGRAITKRDENGALGPWWTSNNAPTSPSQYNRAFPLLPTPTRRFSETDWTVTVLRDDDDIDLDYRHRRSIRRNSRK